MPSGITQHRDVRCKEANRKCMRWLSPENHHRTQVLESTGDVFLCFTVAKANHMCYTEKGLLIPVQRKLYPPVEGCHLRGGDSAR